MKNGARRPFAPLSHLAHFWPRLPSALRLLASDELDEAGPPRKARVGPSLSVLLFWRWDDEGRGRDRTDAGKLAMRWTGELRERDRKDRGGRARLLVVCGCRCLSGYRGGLWTRRKSSRSGCPSGPFPRASSVPSPLSRGCHQPRPGQTHPDPPTPTHTPLLLQYGGPEH